jgi:hypothetical protein
MVMKNLTRILAMVAGLATSMALAAVPGAGGEMGGMGRGRGGAATDTRPRGEAPSLAKVTTPTTKPAADGFIGRWIVLEPIVGAQGVTEPAIQAAVKKEYFPNQLSVIPKDGDAVTVAGAELVWHAYDSRNFNFSTYHFSFFLNKPTNNVLWWAVTVINCPEEMKDVRLSIGSNDASVWWVNGQEVIGNYGDRPDIFDDAISKRITLKKGPNVIRAAIHNQQGQTDFCARILDKAGNPVTNFTVSLSADGR